MTEYVIKEISQSLWMVFADRKSVCVRWRKRGPEIFGRTQRCQQHTQAKVRVVGLRQKQTGRQSVEGFGVNRYTDHPSNPAFYLGIK
jgi:hypothetical protein